MARKNKKGRAKRRNVSALADEPDELKCAPHSFVVVRGKSGHCYDHLATSIRHIMEPYTASSLKLKIRTVKDLAAVAGKLKVSHFIVFSRTRLFNYMKIGCFPRGPTLVFRVLNYTLARDVLRSQRKPFTFSAQFRHPALLILDGFSEAPAHAKHVRLMCDVLRHAWPVFNVNRVRLSAVHRVVLFSYCAADDTVHFRHYAIRATPAGVSRSVRKLLLGARVPNMCNHTSIEDFVMKNDGASDSEMEDDTSTTVQLPEGLSSRGNRTPGAQSAIRLKELGPRLTLKLVKVVSGLFDGDVLHHALVSKSAEQIAADKSRVTERENLKLARKQLQEANVKRKLEAKKLNTRKRRKSQSTTRKHILAEAAHECPSDHE